MNHLFFGDNLDVLRKHVENNSVDLIYLDPPFNSKRDYNVIFKEASGKEPAAQVRAFTDTWHYTQKTANTKEEINEVAPRYHCAKLPQIIQGFEDVLGRNDVTAYLIEMAIRLLELKRVLKPTGSFYLHCDPTASHYLKIVLDIIFGKTNFRNEIIWHYRKWSVAQAQFVSNHDVIFFFSKTNDAQRTFNTLFMERAASTLKRFGNKKIISGHDEVGNRLPSQMDEEESEGVAMDDVWDIRRVPPIKQLFPTQKPILLLQRILESSTKKGDLILDPFCGCGTTICAAQLMERRWIGIDITYLSTNLIKNRLKDEFNLEAKKNYRISGEPVDIASAIELANTNRNDFQLWALSLIPAYGDESKKGADGGIDGVIYFTDGSKSETRTITAQVKSGHVSVPQIRDLRGVIERDKSAMGFFVCLEEPTKPMIKEAASAGFYISELWSGKFPRLQIRTIAELFEGKGFEFPKQARKVLKRSEWADKEQGQKALTLESE